MSDSGIALERYPVSVANSNAERSQTTKPKKGKPIEIPVPKREDVDKLLKKAAKPRGKRDVG